MGIRTYRKQIYKMADAELALTYATLILHDGGAHITAENLKKVVAAAGIENVQPYWFNTFAKCFGTADIEAMCSSFSVAAPAAGAAPAAAAGGDAPAAAEEEEPEKSSSEDFGGGGGLFGDDDEDDW